jgi:uracil phosphoribosyltransferase
MHETAYSQESLGPTPAYGQVPHHYGSQVRLVACPVLLSQLATLCSQQTQQPQVTHLVRDLFAGLMRAALSDVWPRQNTAVPTRMAAKTAQGRGVWHGQVLDRKTRAVVVGLARAGTIAAQTAYDMLNELVEPACVRQDHIYMNRVSGPRGGVTGIDVAGSKIGGDVADALVFVPDPMAATGASMAHAIGMYKALKGGRARQIVALHLIVTPEYLHTLKAQHPDVAVYALRLDRGMSPPDLLTTPLGARWQDERGLNEHDYIVPGAGGLGELLNNSYV